MSDAAGTSSFRYDSAIGGMKSAIATTCAFGGVPGVVHAELDHVVADSLAPVNGGSPTSQRAVKCCVKSGTMPGTYGMLDRDPARVDRRLAGRRFTAEARASAEDADEEAQRAVAIDDAGLDVRGALAAAQDARLAPARGRPGTGARNVDLQRAQRRIGGRERAHRGKRDDGLQAAEERAPLQPILRHLERDSSVAAPGCGTSEPRTA